MQQGFLELPQGLQVQVQLFTFSRGQRPPLCLAARAASVGCKPVQRTLEYYADDACGVTNGTGHHGLRGCRFRKPQHAQKHGVMLRVCFTVTCKKQSNLNATAKHSCADCVRAAL